MRTERYLERLMAKLERRDGGCLIERNPSRVEASTPLYRTVYIRLRGPVPKHADLRPTCGERRCVNPDHRKVVFRIKQMDGTKACSRCRVRFRKIERSGSYCATCDRKRDCRQARASRAYRADTKAQVVRALGGACVCCGEREWAFLTIDHIHNDGAEERRELVRQGRNMDGWRMVKRSGFDTSRYQLLCMNCNLGKQLCGMCPHQQGATLTGSDEP